MAATLQFWGEVGLYGFWAAVVVGTLLYARSKL